MDASRGIMRKYNSNAKLPLSYYAAMQADEQKELGINERQPNRSFVFTARKFNHEQRFLHHVMLSMS